MLPSTYTLSPFLQKRSAMSARLENFVFQNTTRCHSVFSCFSPALSFHWRLVAMDNVATRDPFVVLRTSGSAPRFPTKMALFILRLTVTSRVRGSAVNPRIIQRAPGRVAINCHVALSNLRMLLERQPEHQGVLFGIAVVGGSLADGREAGAQIQRLG